MYRRILDDRSLFMGKKIAGHQKPAIDVPEEKEVLNTEVLTLVGSIPTPEVEHEHMRRIDERLVEMKPHHAIRDVKFNELYGTTRGAGDWRYLVDNYAIGQFTTIAGATIQVPVTMQIALDNKRLMQWPGSTQLFLCLRSYAQTPIVKTLTTPVGMTTIFQDNAGMGVPVMATISDTPQNMTSIILFPSAITDSGILTVGNLLVKLDPTGTTATYDYMLAFSYAYMVATETPYEHPKQTKGGPLHVTGSKADSRDSVF